MMFAVLFSISAQDLMTKITNYQDNEQWIDGYKDIKSAITQEADKDVLKLAYSELSWITMEYGNVKERAGELKGGNLADIFAEGEQYGLKSADLGNPEGYFWAAANLGRWAETKGILKSLARAEPMRQYLIKATTKLPRHADSWDLMGMLYFGLSKQDTGMWNMKFGDINKSISFDRLKVDCSDGTPILSHLFELSKHLYKRDFSVSQRMGKRKKDLPQYNSKKVLWEKNEYYEGKSEYNKAYSWTNGKALKDLSDKEEAKLGLNFIISEITKMESAGTANKGDKRQLESAKNLLKEI